MEGGKKARGEEGGQEGELGPFNDPDLESRIMKIEDLQEELEKVSEVLILVHNQNNETSKLGAGIQMNVVIVTHLVRLPPRSSI